MNSGKLSRTEGTGGKIEGSTRGPRGPKKMEENPNNEADDLKQLKSCGSKL